jgi:hypothetical protein
MTWIAAGLRAPNGLVCRSSYSIWP